MPELDARIREYIDATSTPLTVDEILDEQAITEPTPARQSSGRGLAVAAAAAAVVLAALLPIWFIGEESPVATTPEPTPTTIPNPLTTSPRTEIAPGRKLRFTAVPQPGGEHLGTGVWFQGTFYALGEEGNLYETADGFTWEPISLDLGFSPNDVPDSFRFTELEATNDLMVIAGETEADIVGGESCETSEHLFQVTVVDASGRTTTTAPPLSTPRVDCYSVNPSISVGSKGILISGSIFSPPEGPAEVAFGMHSVDGTVWTDLGRVGPFSSAQVEGGALATSDGFFAAPTGPDVDGPIFFSSDGLNWTVSREVSADDGHVVWDGQLLVETSEGYAPYDNPTQILIPSDPSRPSRLFFGEMGIIAGAGGGYGDDLPAHEPFAFSVNGTDWAIWQPPEFVDVGFAVSLVGIADDFAVFSDWEGQQLWIGTPDK